LLWLSSGCGVVLLGLLPGVGFGVEGAGFRQPCRMPTSGAPVIPVGDEVRLHPDL
jgi:hypothetical protein